MISTDSSTKLSLSSSRSSFIGMTRDSSNKHFFRLEMWKVLWTGTDIKEMDKDQSKNGQSRTREGKSAQEPGIIKL
ncbi:hypothetical protein Tco_1162120 [Tanacetum coccineum]